MPSSTTDSSTASRPSAAVAPRIVLASGSRYRQELLSRLRLPFEAIAPDIDESPLPGERPETTALRLAQDKARAIVGSMPGGLRGLVIGSDQVATLDRRQIGKPGDHANALRQLQSMRGRCVLFHTALCLWDARGERPVVQTANVQVAVTFRDLPDDELDAYLRIEQPYDCAGSAKNEGLGITLIEKIDSTDPTALTGLPLITLTSMLRNRGVAFYGTGAPA